MPTITLVGSGGVIFAQNFIKDILLCDTLRDSELVLMDINAERLDNALRLTRKLAGSLKVSPRVRATTDLRDALRGADYVITIFRVGTLDEQRIEQEIPRQYGVDQVVGDTLGPGGVFRGLRTLNGLFDVLDSMERECPGAMLLNYVNPMSINTIALSRRARTVKVVGLCHSVPHTAATLARYLDVSPPRLRYQAAGVNHQAFFLKLETDGHDAYPRLREAMQNPDLYHRDRVRFEWLRHFGYFPTESSGHGSEYVPYIRKRADLVDRFCALPPDAEKDYSMVAGTSGAALKVCMALQTNNERQTAALLSGDDAFDLSPSDEYAIQLIRAMETDRPLSANLNVMNQGLMPSLPPDACVEVPCLVNGAGIAPCRIDDYPEQLAALNRGMINVQLLAAEGALEGDRRKIFQAIALDPLTAAVCSLDEIQSMTTALFDALADSLPASFRQRGSPACPIAR